MEHGLRVIRGSSHHHHDSNSGFGYLNLIIPFLLHSLPLPFEIVFDRGAIEVALSFTIESRIKIEKASLMAIGHLLSVQR